MGARHRYIDRRDWHRVTERVCYSRSMPNGGWAFRTDILRVLAPGMGFLPGVGACMIANEGWRWTSFMRPDFPWALTVMSDEQGQWVQAYFDLITGMGCDADRRAWFTDAWLDVVALPDGRLFLLDEDELAQAVDAGEISPMQAEEVAQNAQRLLTSLSGAADRLFAFAQTLQESFTPADIVKNM